jgi:hypothetical protein
MYVSRISSEERGRFSRWYGWRRRGRYADMSMGGLGSFILEEYVKSGSMPNKDYYSSVT